MENKTVLRGKKQITVKDEDLRPLVVRAYAESKLPLFEIEVGGHSYYIVPTEDFDDYAQLGGP